MLIDQLFPNDVVTESAYGAAAGVETIKQLIHAVKDSKDIDLKVGPEMFPVRYDEARYLLSLWKANRDGGDKTADLFGNVNWIQDKLEDRDYRMGPGKLKDIDIERAKEIQKDKVLNLEGECDTCESDCHCDHIKKRRDEMNEAEFEITYKDPQFTGTRTHTIKSVNAKKAQEKFLSFGNPYKVLGVKKKEAVKEYKLEPRDKEDKLEKLKTLNQLLVDPNTSKDPELKKAIHKRISQLQEDYKGWKYGAETIEYDDNRKISHFATKDGKEVSMDWSPYSTPTEEDFKLWVDLDMPDRKAVDGIGPLNIDDLIQLAKDKPEVTHSLLTREDKEDPVDQSKLDAKTKVALKKAGLKYGAQTKGDPLASLVTFVADKDTEKTQDIDRLDQENDQEEKDIATQAQVDKKHDTAIGNNSLKDRYQDQEIEKLKQDLQKLLAR